MATVIPTDEAQALCELYGIADAGIPARYWDRITEAIKLAEECTPATRPAPFTPCTPAHKKCNRAHAEMMRAFWDAQQAQYVRAEAVAIGYPEETRDYYRDVEARLTLPLFLKSWKGMGGTDGE